MREKIMAWHSVKEIHNFQSSLKHFLACESDSFTKGILLGIFYCSVEHGDMAVIIFI